MLLMLLMMLMLLMLVMFWTGVLEVARSGFDVRVGSSFLLSDLWLLLVGFL